jgi:hypothetical protein
MHASIHPSWVLRGYISLRPFFLNVKKISPKSEIKKEMVLKLVDLPELREKKISKNCQFSIFGLKCTAKNIKG